MAARFACKSGSKCQSEPSVCRDKNRLPLTPILSSVLRLVRYHLGTVAKGSFIITLVKIPRLVLMYIHNQLKGRVCNPLRRRPDLVELSRLPR